MEDFGKELVIGIIVTIIMLPLGLIGGMLLEHSKDIIKGKDRKKNGLKNRFRLALEAVHEAEERMPSVLGVDLGTKRFDLALDIYHEWMGAEALEDANIIQMMFDQSTLSHK